MPFSVLTPQSGSCTLLLKQWLPDISSKQTSSFSGEEGGEEEVRPSQAIHKGPASESGMNIPTSVPHSGV